MVSGILTRSFRRLSRRPGTTLMSALVLGIALGLTAFLFNLVHRTILQPLPFHHPDRLVAIGHANVSGMGVGMLSNEIVLALRDKLEGVEALGAYGVSDRVLGGQGHVPASYEQAGMLTASAMHLLGVRPLLGRRLVASDGAPGASPVVVLGESLWRQRYHADPDILGRSLRVDGVWARVVGVMPKRFGFPDDSQLWLPLQLQAGRHFEVVGLARLKPGASLARLRAQLSTLEPQLKAMTYGANRARKLIAKPLALAVVHEDIRHWVALMFMAGLLVLLLACANVSNLQLVQVLNRRHELALRGALGCGRARLMLDALADGAWLALASLLVAWPVYEGAGHWLAQVYADNDRAATSAFITPHLGIWVVVFMLVTGLLSTTLAALVPVWRLSRGGLQARLGDGSRGSGAGFARTARVMVVFEIALTVILLVGAGTMIRGLRQILAEPPPTSVPATQVLVANLAVPSIGSGNDTSRIALFRQIAQHLRDDPEVTGASITNAVPDVTYGSNEYIAAQGQPRPPQGWINSGMGVVDTHFLSTFGGRLLEGRFFNDRDTANSLPVTVIDRTTAQRLWPGRDAVGQKLVLHPEASAKVLTVVGVIRSVRMSGPFEPPQPELLLPLRQVPLRAAAVAVHVRAADARSYAMRLRRRVQQVASQVAVYQELTQARMQRMSRIGIWVLVKVFGFLGLVALGLAAAGLYGVLAFTVARRTREIGIRRAIGAGHGAIVRTVARQLAWQLAVGLAIGALLAWPWTEALASVGGVPVRVNDPLVLTSVTSVIVATVAVATLVPLWRALRVDPAVALRCE